MKKTFIGALLLVSALFLFGCSSSDSPPPPPPPAPTLAFNISSAVDFGPVPTGELNGDYGYLYIERYQSWDQFYFSNFALNGSVTDAQGGPDFVLNEARMGVKADIKDAGKFGYIYADFSWVMNPEEPIVWSGSTNPTAGAYTMDQVYYNNVLLENGPFSAQITMYPLNVDVVVGEDEETWDWEVFEEYTELADEPDVREVDIWASVANGSRGFLINQLGSIVQNAFDAIDENAEALEEDGEVAIACDPYTFPIQDARILTDSGVGELESRILITRNNKEGSAYDLVFTCFMSEGAEDTGTLLYGILYLDDYAAQGTAGSTGNDYYRHAIVTWDGIYNDGGPVAPAATFRMMPFVIDEISPEENDTYFISGIYRVSIGDTPEEER